MAEQDYIDWLNSIEFIKKNGQVLPTKLVEDTSDDPENDREQEVVTAE